MAAEPMKSDLPASHERDPQRRRPTVGASPIKYR
jgi:hypothetical protein